MTESSELIRARYVGDGQGVIFGIPKRDVTESEYRALSNEQRARMRASALYEVKTDAEIAEELHPPPARTRRGRSTESEAEPEAGGEDNPDGE